MTDLTAEELGQKMRGTLRELGGTLPPVSWFEAILNAAVLAEREACAQVNPWSVPCDPDRNGCGAVGDDRCITPLGEYTTRCHSTRWRAAIRARTQDSEPPNRPPTAPPSESGSVSD